MSTIEHEQPQETAQAVVSQETTPTVIAPEIDDVEATPANPNKKRNGIIAGLVVGGTAIAAVLGSNTVSNNSREAQLTDKTIAESIAEEQAAAGNGNDIIENPTIDVPAETAPPAEVTTPVEEASPEEVGSLENVANTLTDEQIQEILVKCPGVTEFYPDNAIDLIRQFNEGEAQSIYKSLQDDPEATEIWILSTLARYNNQ